VLSASAYFCLRSYLVPIVGILTPEIDADFDYGQNHPSTLRIAHRPRLPFGAIPHGGNAIQFGVAVKSGNRICLSLRGKAIPLNTTVTLVTTSAQQSTAIALVVELSSSTCPGIKDDQSSYTSYQLRVAPGTSDVQENMPLIAAIALPSQFKKHHEMVEAHLPGPLPSQFDTFQSCTSADGVHLTVWQGKPLVGKRVWHQYYYLGQDLEQTCTVKETAP
jgi:hypothetical protein